MPRGMMARGLRSCSATSAMRSSTAEMPSADLVKALVELEGHPWAELGKSRKPLTQNRMARMLKPLGVATKKIGPGKTRVNGYVHADFEEAFGRYLGSEGVLQPDNRTNAMK
jgi:uncharacterized protein DUF3631